MRLLKCFKTILNTRLKSNLTSGENYKKLVSWLDDTEVLYGPTVGNDKKSASVSNKKNTKSKKMKITVKKIEKSDVDSQVGSYSKSLMKKKIEKNIDTLDGNKKAKTSSKKVEIDLSENLIKTENKTKKSQLKKEESPKNKTEFKTKEKKCSIQKEKSPTKKTKTSLKADKEKEECDEVDLKIARLMEIPLEEDPDDEFHDYTLASQEEVAILLSQCNMNTISESNIDKGEMTSQIDSGTSPKKDKDQFLNFILEQPLLPNNKEYNEQQFNFPKTDYLPSVSTILKNTMSPENVQVLNEWEKRMITQLGVEGFQEYKTRTFETGRLFHEYISSLLLTIQNTNIPLSQILNITSNHTISDNTALITNPTSTNHHQSTTHLITPQTHQNTTQQHTTLILPPTIPPSIEKHFESVKHVICDVSNVFCVEAPVTHASLKYRGILDCIGDYEGVRCLIEWKTAKKKKSSIQYTYDNPVQIVAYMAAYNESLSRPQHLLSSSSFSSPNQYTDNCLTSCTPLEESNTSLSSSSFSSPSFSFSPSFSSSSSSPQIVSNGLIVIAYEDGSKADVHKMGSEYCHLVWCNWLERLQLFWKNYKE